VPERIQASSKANGTMCQQGKASSKANGNYVPPKQAV